MAFGYARVSGHKQTKDLEKQKQSIQNYTDKNGYGGCQIFVDIASGLNDQRRNLQRLIKAVAIYQPEVSPTTIGWLGLASAVLPTFWNQTRLDLPKRGSSCGTGPC
ncbi:MAG: hypothetical protein D6732_11885 [Methanobacteriota archaeon]|nr:MAG: hypothetical protein D6732_11885 [Euryarchaeota archaeon]